MVRSTIRTIVLLLLILGQTSCIREGLQECEEEYFVTIKVVDALTGEDITASGEVSHADLFVFDADEQYRYTVRADSAEEGENYYQTLHDLFFGIAQIGKSLKSPIRNEEIIIARKNARMYLTVRGLPAFHRAIDYYFTIHLNNNGYNFKGTPVPNAIEIKQNGITLANNDFVSPSSFNLIHTDSNREDYATVNLYRRSDAEYGEDILIASINSDLNGNPIVLPAGLTTNLLIDLRQEISVHVKTSPWEKREQWVEW